MALTLILTFLASCLAGLTYYFAGLYHDIRWVWVPFVVAFGYFWALFAVHVLYMAVVAFFLRRSKKTQWPPNRYAMWMIGETCYVLNFLFRVHVHATGMGKVPSPKTKFMIVSNHLSSYDYIALLSILVKHRIVCVSKMANMSIPVAGPWLRFAGFLAIVQGDIAQGTSIIAKAGEYIKDDVASIAISPEGTRNREFPEHEMLPFHSGSFQMAMDAKCPIVIFALQNTNAVFKRFPWKRTDLYCDCVGMVEYEEYEHLSLNELSHKCQALIARRFEQKRARFYHLKKKPEPKEEER